MSAKEKSLETKTIFNYELTPHQDAIFNYLLPSLSSFLLYVILIASECALIFRHFKDENPIWASLTLFLMFLPSLCSYMVIISSWELWPDMEGCGRDNLLWFMVKTLEHFLFPVWAIWRFAERVFWSIEAVLLNEEKDILEAKNAAIAPRSVELYFFLQAFLHSLPQTMLQLNILMRQNYQIDKQTADAEILSFTFNLARIATTISFYQRFKSQKLAGKQYPWFKSYKQQTSEVDNLVRPLSLPPDRPVSESRRSSDFYLEPELRETPITIRETSVLDGPQRQLFAEISEPDFNVRRVVNIKGLPEDDLAGKLVSFFWWSGFLLARILAISTFFYFYPKATVWILVAHFVVVIAFLVYDVKSDEVKRAKAVFFVFIGLMFIFCIIEFKIKFKKTKFMYCGFFALVFIENFTMCLIWWQKNVGEMESAFWFRYIFYIVIMCSLISVSSMLLYLNIYKPQKVVVAQRTL